MIYLDLVCINHVRLTEPFSHPMTAIVVCIHKGKQTVRCLYSSVLSYWMQIIIEKKYRGGTAQEPITSAQ